MSHTPHRAPAPGDDTDPAYADSFLVDAHTPPAYRARPVAPPDGTWAPGDSWLDEPDGTPAPRSQHPDLPPAAVARPTRSWRLTAVAGVALVAAATPATVAALGHTAGPASAAVVPPALPVATPPTASPEPTPEPTVDAPAAPLLQRPAPVIAPPAAAPPAPGPVTGIPQPCSTDLPFPASGPLSATVARMERQWGLELAGPQWRDERYRPIVKIFSETMDAVDCTDYLTRVKAGNGGRLQVNSGSTRSWAWGDYGLTRPGVLTLDFTKFLQGHRDGDRGRLVRLIIHEMAHSLNADRGGEPAYWQRFHPVWKAHGRPTAYGTNETEAFAEAVGYYVARCAAESPYRDLRHAPYYDYVKRNIFHGREFGGPVATRQLCDGEGR